MLKTLFLFYETFIFPYQFLGQNRTPGRWSTFTFVVKVGLLLLWEEARIDGRFRAMHDSRHSVNLLAEIVRHRIVKE
jgi:hypothetical protein